MRGRGAVLGAVMVLAGCGAGGSARGPTTTLPPITAPKDTIVVPSTAATTVPPTAAPTAAPTSTAGRGDRPARDPAEEVLARLYAAGLPVLSGVTYTAATDPNHLLGRPGGYTAKTSFVDSRIPAEEGRIGDVERGGSIEVFPTEDGARKRAAYVGALGANAPIFAEYDYLRGPVLLRLSKVLTPAQAAEYQKALNS